MNFTQVFVFISSQIDQCVAKLVVDDAGLQRGFHHLQHGEHQPFGTGQESPCVVEVPPQCLAVESFCASSSIVDSSTLVAILIIGSGAIVTAVKA